MSIARNLDRWNGIDRRKVRGIAFEMRLVASIHTDDQRGTANEGPIVVCVEEMVWIGCEHDHRRSSAKTATDFPTLNPARRDDEVHVLRVYIPVAKRCPV